MIPLIVSVPQLLLRYHFPLVNHVSRLVKYEVNVVIVVAVVVVIAHKVLSTVSLTNAWFSLLKKDIYSFAYFIA